MLKSSSLKTGLQRVIYLLVIAGLSSIARAQTPESRLVFDPPREATFRQTSGTLGRALLVSIDPIHIRIRLPNGTDKDVPIENIQFLRTTDRQFSYSSKDDVRAVIAKGAELEDTLMEAAMLSSESENSETNGGFGTAKKDPTAPEMNNGGFGTAKPPTTPPNGGFGTPQPNRNDSPQTIVTCANCNKDVHGSAEYGQTCPHCGIEWSLDNPATAAADLSSNNQANGSSPNPAPQGRPVSPMNAVPQAAPPSSNLPPSSNTSAQGQELTLANIPIWMKAAMFIAFAAGGYYMFFYRA